MPSQNPTDPERDLIRDETKGTVRSAMARLTDVERKIIRARFGLDDTDPVTLQAIGIDLGISRERVRQIEIHAKDKIRIALNSKPLRGRMERDERCPLPPGDTQAARAS